MQIPRESEKPAGRRWRWVVLSIPVLGALLGAARKYPALSGYLETLPGGQSVSLLLERRPKHPDDQSCRRWIYAPPNGLWIYKIGPSNPNPGQ